LDEFNEYDGNEILDNTNKFNTTMRQMYYEKWRRVNSESMRLRSGKSDILSNLRMLGKPFPCEIKLMEGMSPPCWEGIFLKDTDRM